MEGSVEHSFQVLADYTAAQKKASQEIQPRTSKKVCAHEGVNTEEHYVCCKCGLVLEDIYRPDVHWFEHAMLDRQYTDADRLNAVDKTLIGFLEKLNLSGSIPMYPIQERLRAMKIAAGYRTLNYAIALTCIIGDDKEAQEKLTPFLPRSNVAWARSLDILAPVPTSFIRSWLVNLLRQCPSRDLTKTQKKRFGDSLNLFNDTERQIMYDLIKCYGLTAEPDLDSLPLDLRHVLYRFGMALKK